MKNQEYRNFLNVTPCIKPGGGKEAWQSAKRGSQPAAQKSTGDLKWSTSPFIILSCVHVYIGGLFCRTGQLKRYLATLP